MAKKPFLKSFTLPSGQIQDKYLLDSKNPKLRITFHNSAYPFKILNFWNHDDLKLQFGQITLLYGNNGSGKSTLLNVIAEKIEAERYTQYNGTVCFSDFCYHCNVEQIQIPYKKRIISSDEVFEKMLSLRDANTYKLERQMQIYKEKYENLDNRVREVHFDDENSIKAFEKNCNLRRLSFSKLVKLSVGSDIALHSNGETAYHYFIDMIEPGGLYLLDEPENSLSANLQEGLAEFIATMAETGHCQFIIATHSPFFLSIPKAILYNMDKKIITKDRWTNLPTIKAYYNLFKKREAEFEEKMET